MDAKLWDDNWGVPYFENHSDARGACIWSQLQVTKHGPLLHSPQVPQRALTQRKCLGLMCRSVQACADVQNGDFYK